MRSFRIMNLNLVSYWIDAPIDESIPPFVSRLSYALLGGNK